jgi:membrane-associated protease RseP (regulator of RpoE activity)
MGVMLLNKKKVHVEKIFFPLIYMVMYRTKIGLNLMDRIAKKHPRLAGMFAISGIIIGFIGMVAILILLAKGVYAFLFLSAPPPVAPLFPGVQTAPGLPILSFFHWILAIFVLAGVHEFSHGLVARLYNLKVKSSGFAVFSFILPIIPAAFVEPDEEELNSAKKKVQHGVLAAGSFSNLLTAGVFFLLFLFVLTPLASAVTVSEGVIIRGVNEESPAFESGLGENELILELNDREINDVGDFIDNLKGLQAGEVVELKTNESDYSIIAIEHPSDDRGYLGVNVSPEKVYIDEKYGFLGEVISWFALLFFWIFVANFGVGLFNLLPMGPLDGGKMFYLVALSIFKKEKTAKRVWMGVSFFCLALIVISLAPFLGRLLGFVFGIVTGLF